MRLALRSLMNKLLTGFILVFHTNVFAETGGNELGNGGDVVLCGDPSLLAYETLDVFEAREMRGMHMDLPDLTDPMKIAWVAVERLKRLDPTRTVALLNILESFWREAIFLENPAFPNIDDSEHFPLPRNCGLRQAVIQRTKVFSYDKTFIFDEKVWEQLDIRNKAVLILHEAIYYHALRHGHNDSAATRYFNSLLFSNNIRFFSQEDYQLFLEQADLEFIEWTDDELGARWLVSDVKTPSFIRAKEYCESHNMEVFPFGALTLSHIKNLRDSYIGKRVLTKPEGFVAWARDATHDMREIQVVFTPGKEEVLSEQVGSAFALCFQSIQDKGHL